MDITIHNIYPVTKGPIITNQALVPHLKFINRFLSRNGNLLFYKESVNAISDLNYFSLTNCQGNRPPLCSTIRCNTSGHYILALSLDHDVQASNYNVMVSVNGNTQSVPLDNNYSAKIPIDVLINDRISVQIDGNNNVWGIVVMYQ